MLASVRSVRIVAAVAAMAALALASCSSPEDRAQDDYQRALKLLAANDQAGAAVELKSALQIEGDMVPALRALAQIDETLQDWPAVSALLRRVAALEPGDVEVRLKLARLALLAGAIRDALDWTNAAVTIDERRAETRALRALILLKSGDESAAIREAQSAIEIDHDNADAPMVLAAARMTHDDPEGALKILDGIPPAHKDDLAVELFKVNVDEKLGRIQQAEERLQRLVDLNSNDPGPRAQLLQLYLAHRQPQQAEQLLRKVAAANPRDTNAELDLVRLLNRLEGPAAARAELTARVQRGGDIFSYQLASAELDLSERNFAAGIERLKATLPELKNADRVLSTRLLLAQIHVEAKDFHAAESVVADILRDDPRNANAFRLRASIRLGQGRPDDAVNDLRLALSEQPRSAEIMSMLALAYERSGSMELADRQFVDAMRASDFASSFGLAYVAFLQRRGEQARAEDILAELTRRHPTDVAVQSSLAQVRLARQNWAGAREIAETIRRLGDKDGVADQILAAAFDGQKKYADSIAVLKEASSANPGASDLMFSLVRSYVLAGQADKAAAYVDFVLSKDPGNADALVLKGLVQAADNAADEALKSFRGAITAQPKYAVGYRALADFYANRKEFDQGLEVLQAGLRQLPESVPLRLAQAGILELKGDYEAAIAGYDSLVQEQPGLLLAANNLASLLSEHRTDKTSLERANALAKSLAKSPVPQFKDTLGWISNLRGDTRAAISLLEEAVTAMPNSPLVRYHLAMSYVAAGQVDKARSELRKAADLLPPDGGALAEKIRAGLKG